MIFLKTFKLLSEEHECGMISKRIFNTYYPLGIFPRKELSNIEFSHITIFYGEMVQVKLPF